MARFHLSDLDGHLVLVDRAFPKQAPLQIDFCAPKLLARVERGGKKELLLRAVGAKSGLRVSDWTAGLGTDSFLLAAAGCQIQLHERSRVLQQLLSQAIRHGLEDQRIQGIVERMTLFSGDARLSEAEVDVIYLDPMFPQRSKRALVNGPMQYLQRFIGPDEDADELVACALKQKVSRVVVKRSAAAPNSGATFTLSAKANRFDVYELPGAGCN